MLYTQLILWKETKYAGYEALFDIGNLYNAEDATSPSNAVSDASPSGEPNKGSGSDLTPASSSSSVASLESTDSDVMLRSPQPLKNSEPAKKEKEKKSNLERAKEKLKHKNSKRLLPSSSSDLGSKKSSTKNAKK